MKKKNILLFFAIFVLVLVPYAIAYQHHWFHPDDLGTILNGLVKNWRDFFRIFTEDMRNYSTPYNYNVATPNVISGYLRPIQNLFFSLIHPFFGTSYYPYLFTIVTFHALNSSLFFLVLTHMLSTSYAVLGALLFAFYPDTGWIGIICTFQHSLLIFFFLLSILAYLPLLKQKHSFGRSPLFYLSGFFFLISLLSRENLIFLAPWIFLGVYLLENKMSTAFAKTWIFFAATFVYFLFRLQAFGITTLPRTIRSATVILPFLKKIFPTSPSPLATAPQAVQVAQATVQKAAPVAAQKVASITPKITLLSKIQSKFFKFFEQIVNFMPRTFLSRTLALFLILFFIALFIISYRKHKKIFFFFVSGIPLFIWPSLMLSPYSRYMHPVYLLFITALLMGMFFASTRAIKAPYFLLAAWLLCSGFHINIFTQAQRKISVQNSALYQFAQTAKIPPHSHLIFFAPPGEYSDLAERFQVMRNDFTLNIAVVNLVISHAGPDYTITSIPDGFRFTTTNPATSGWHFLRLRPSRWNEAERAYNVATEYYKENQWYQFSMGKFIIHKMKNLANVQDISIVFNKKFLTKNTLFVVKKKNYEILT